MLHNMLSIAVLDLLFDPDLKRVADDAVAQVDQPLFWDFSRSADFLAAKAKP